MKADMKMMKNHKKNNRIRRFAALALAAACLVAGCGSSSEEEAWDTSSESVDALNNGNITVGFAQVGEESDWRRANSDSIRRTFTTENGYNLLFEDAQNDQSVQISSVSRFIQEGVDYIVLEPILETGWDTVLEEVKKAGIPIIVADRTISVEDESLYTVWVGSDVRLEGDKVCAWMHSYLSDIGFDESGVNVGVIQGTVGSGAQLGREQSLRLAAERYGWSVLGYEEGEFTQAKGREAAEKLLEEYPEMNVLYCDNDNEAFGALEAIDAAGKTAGTDIENGEIMVVAFDATKKALQYVQDGVIACDGECDPDNGPMIEEIIQKLEAGESVPKKQYMDETIFAFTDSISSVEVDGTSYEVQAVTDDLLSTREY